MRAATPSHPHSACAAAARTPMPITGVRQAYAHPHPCLHPGRPPAAAAPGGNPAMQASTRLRPHPTRADTAHTPMHATRDCPTRARACRRPSGGARPPGTAQPSAQEHGTPTNPQGRPATAPSACAQRSRAEDTDRSPATDQRSHAHPPTPTAPAPRAQCFRDKHRMVLTLFQANIPGVADDIVSQATLTNTMSIDVRTHPHRPPS